MGQEVKVEEKKIPKRIESKISLKGGRFIPYYIID